MTIFFGVDGDDLIDRNQYLPRCSCKTTFKFNVVITKNQRTRCIKTNVENYLAIFDVFTRDLNTVVDRHGNIRR